MNKHQKNQILAVINDLLVNHKVAYNQMQNAEMGDSYSLFVQCQQSAISIGTRLELLAAGEKRPVQLLEEYCELLYQYSLHIIETNEFTEQMRENLDNILYRVDIIICDEIESKAEIVFVPYNAYMWDSLESIWKAAKDNPNCTCRVIPIPYFTKDRDGNFLEMHYEGDFFPPYVPVTHYNEYSLEENRPDIIYFHNPYDNYNFTTSVHPAFYSSELKKYTNMLVYIPYFVTAKTIPEHLVETIGVFHADKVIVQSKGIKEIYKKAYVKILGEMQRDKEKRTGDIEAKFWNRLECAAEDKFLALGSPKIDKVIYYMNYKPEIPEEWKNIIRKKLSRNKIENMEDIKIILYNTSITTLLEYRHQNIIKIKKVLDAFKGRADVVLLWRPHPLNEATAQSMAPDILHEYLNIVEEYRREEYGIYDDSSDVHRAIALADAYYGDSSSSLIQMFGITGKPIMFQNIQITDKMLKNNRYTIGFEDVIYNGDYIWFSDIDYNGLYRMDVTSNETEWMGMFPDEQEKAKRLYISGVSTGEALVFAPFGAEKGIIFHLDTKRFTKFMAIKEERNDFGLGPEKYACTVLYKNKIIMLPCFYPGIGSYCMEKNEMRYHTKWIDEISHRCKMLKDAFCRRYLIVEEKNIMIPMCNANAVLEYDMDKEKVITHVINDEGNSFSGICYDGKYYWLSPRHNKGVIRWDKECEIITIFDNFPKEFDSRNYSFIDIVYCGGYVWLFPLLANMVIKINPKTGEMERVKEFNYYVKSAPRKKFHWVRTSGNNIYAQATFDNTLLSYNLSNGEIKKSHAFYPEHIQNKICVDYENKVMSNMKDDEIYSEIYKEDNVLTLMWFLKKLTSGIGIKKEMSNMQMKKFQELFENGDGTSGEKIHRSMIKMMEVKND